MKSALSLSGAPIFTVLIYVGCLGVGASRLTGCSASSSTAGPPGVAADALTSSQCAAKSFETTVTGCADAFATCAQAPGADLAACKATLATCLPPAPSGAFDHREHDGGNDNDDDDDGGGDGGASEHHHHGGGRHDGRRGGHRPAPDPAAILACHTQLATCLAATGAVSKTCFDAEHTCTKAAFQAAFVAACATVTTECAGVTSDRCAQAIARCGEGDTGSADGGTVCP